MRSGGLVLLLLFYVVFLAGCSSFTDFVVVNESNHIVEVRYKVKKSSAGPLATSGLPATIETSELSKYGGSPWKEVNSDRFKLENEAEIDTVVLRLKAKEALRLTTIRSYKDDSACDGGSGFPITEILIQGPGGKLELRGDHARTDFVKLSRALCVIEYKE